jgi:hypothetical protein
VPSAVYGAVEEGIFFTDKVQGIKPTQQTMFLFDDAVLAE